LLLCTELPAKWVREHRWYWIIWALACVVHRVWGLCQ